MKTLQEQRDMQAWVFGPYDSRRFGRSLGINSLPPGGRFCNFDCIYCECATASWPVHWKLRPQFPSPDQIRDALIAAAENPNTGDLDSLTIAGNGEPTLTPYLDEIVDVVTAARDRDWPQARTVILTNGTMCHKPSVSAALAKLDQRVVKLDAGTNWLLDEMNRPAGKLCMTELVRRISMLADVTVQSMFVHGPIDNTGQAEVEAWIGWLRSLAPLEVQIYSLDRIPSKSWVRQACRGELSALAKYVESMTGIHARAF